MHLPFPLSPVQQSHPYCTNSAVNLCILQSLESKLVRSFMEAATHSQPSGSNQQRPRVSEGACCHSRRFRLDCKVHAEGQGLIREGLTLHSYALWMDSLLELGSCALLHCCMVLPCIYQWKTECSIEIYAYIPAVGWMVRVRWLITIHAYSQLTEHVCHWTKYPDRLRE